jgi:hypothetical protein
MSVTTIQENTLVVQPPVGDLTVYQRDADGYLNATDMCRANGKNFNDYTRLASTQAFLRELARVTGIPVSGLVVVERGGDAFNSQQGSWIHPDIAINLAQWLSPRFAVAVSRFIRERMMEMYEAMQPRKMTYLESLQVLVEQVRELERLEAEAAEKEKNAWNAREMG